MVLNAMPPDAISNLKLILNKSGTLFTVVQPTFEQEMPNKRKIQHFRPDAGHAWTGHLHT